MKTQNNSQKTAKSQISKMVLYSIAVIFSVVLINRTASAQEFWKQLSYTTMNGKVATQMVEKTSVTETTDAVFEFINAEAIEESLEYNPKKFVEEEMATENESLMNFETVTIEESLEYNPKKFVEEEMATEKESLMNDIETLNQVIETEAARQIEVLMNDCQYQAAKFVKTEMASEIENSKINEAFPESAEAYTAIGSEQEVVKYAQKVVVIQNPMIVSK